MGLLKLNLAARESWQDARFEAAARAPERAQAAVLGRMLSRAAGTAFGRQHGFDRVGSPDEYRRAVPVRDFEGFRPYVDRMMAGEQNVLCAQPINYFATTSGTTGLPKFIPVTDEWREGQAALMRLWMLRSMRQHPGCYDGKVVVVVSPAFEGRTRKGVPWGAMSGMTYLRIPWVVRRNYAVPYAACLLADYEDRYFVTTRLALAGSVTAIGAPNPSTLHRLADVARRRGAEIIRSIHDGDLGVTRPEWVRHLTPDERGHARVELLAACRPDPQRARALEAVVERHGWLVPHACWPDLKLVGCWLGGSAGIQAGALEEAFGNVARRDLGLIASEGRMSIPIDDGSPVGCLALHRCFYEFIDEDGIDDPTRPTRLAHELEDGRRYYIVPTSGNGLYRYDINDVVEVRGFHHRAPKIAFVRKGRDMVNITGEKLHLNQIQAALHDAERAGACPIWQFRVIPDVRASRYDLLVEPRPALATPGAATGVPADDFIEAFDRSLIRLNIEYAQKRASGRLGAPRLHVMKSGWSEAACRAAFARGQRDLQYKWPALTEAWDELARASRACVPANDLAVPPAVAVGA